MMVADGSGIAPAPHGAGSWRAAVGAVVVLMVLVCGACSSADTLDRAAVEALIPGLLLDEDSAAMTNVVCPEPIERGLGVTVRCTAELGGATAEFDVTQVDEDGTIDARLLHPVMQVADIEASAADRLAADLGQDYRVACAGPRLRLLDTPFTLACTATEPDDSVRRFTAAVAEDATFSIELG